MKKVLLGVGVVLLLGAATRADVKKDTDKLQGKWVLKSAERGGKPVDLDKEEHVPKSITFKDGKVTIETQKGEQKGSFKIGRAEKLGTLDLTHDEKKEQVIKGIYRLEGDTLTVCVNEGKLSDRPTEFGAKEGSHQVVAVFTRDKGK
jgi:uncharacterized protein (TIGR03067 family)